MQDLNDKVTGGTLTAAEWNEVPSEIQNVIEKTGQALSGADLDQLGKGISSYAATGDFYIDSGSSNSYVLGVVGSKQAPPSYQDGMTIRFATSNPNTGASTVNVAGLGVKNIVSSIGDTLGGGEILANEFVSATYDLSGDYFKLLPILNQPLKVELKSGRKNSIINGNFEIWQREVTQTLSGYGSDDRWFNANSGSTKTHARQSFALGQTDVPGNPDFFSRTVVASIAGASNFVLKYQAIESVKTFSGETITLSFWAKADSAKDIASEFLQNFGTGGSPSANVTGIGVETYSLTTTWQKFTATVAVPSISGKTLGTNDDDYLQVGFWFDAGSDFNSRTNSLGQQSGTFDIARVQVEPGAFATDFEFRPIGEELALCRRYYEKSYNLGALPGSVSTAGRIEENQDRNTANTVPGTRFSQAKRAAPSIVIYSPDTGAANNVSNLTDKAVSSVSFIGENGFADMVIVGGVTTSPARYHYTADAEL